MGSCSLGASPLEGYSPRLAGLSIIPRRAGLPPKGEQTHRKEDVRVAGVNENLSLRAGGTESPRQEGSGAQAIVSGAGRMPL